ncbi:MAG: hypothetical protein WC022_00350 [Parcubacteria group bacterium]
MIKMHYKKISTVLAAVGILTAVGVWADNSASTAGKDQIVQDGQGARQDVRTDNVCDRITQFVDNLNQKASGQENQIRTRQQERLKAWEEKTKNADANLERLRANWDNNRSEQFAKLEEAAVSDNQKKAVNTFEITVKAAIAERRTAENAATKAFQSGVQNNVRTRQGQLDSLISNSSSARVTALAKVQADCTAGASAATVRTDFQNIMKNARTQMQLDKQNVTKVNTAVQDLIQTRHTAMQKAMGDFKATMEKARIALKAAFPDQASGTADTAVTN